MLQVTQVPQESIQVKQQFAIAGVAAPDYAGQSLSMIVDYLYQVAGPTIQPDGSWRVNFVFTQAGNRLLRLSVGTDKVDITIQVVAEGLPRPKLQFTAPPATVEAERNLVLQGKADGYPDGTQLVLRADGRYTLARPDVQRGLWQANVGFYQPGRRLIEILGTEQDQAQITLDVIAAPPPPPPRPRLRFTNPPKSVQVEQAFVLQGDAEGYTDGDQLVLRADRQYQLGRPRVKDQKWQSALLFHGTGQRLIEVLGSEQDRAEIVLEVAPGSLTIAPRSRWTTITTPATLPNLYPKRITIHHTYISPNLSVSASESEELERMQAIWRSHVYGNHWSDIGYHFVIMPSGRIYEARSEHKRGAHDVINDGLGIAFDGAYTNRLITEPQFRAAVTLCTKLCKRYGINDPVTPEPTLTADFGTRNLPRILGHGDRVNTACPGSENGTTVRLNEIRQSVKNQM